MFPRGVVDAPFLKVFNHPWRRPRFRASCSNEYGPAHYGAVRPGGLERSLSTQSSLWFCDFWEPKILQFSAPSSKAALELSQQGSRQGYPWKAKCLKSVVWLLRPGSDDQGRVYQASIKRSPSWSMLWEKLIKCTQSFTAFQLCF